MIPYLNVMKKIKEGEDEPTIFIRAALPNSEGGDNTILDIELMPVQIMLLIQQLSAAMDLDRIDNG
tara:strand:- start:392 stop:589 length:198 start_codon:yes stop_codon:yes gene_type:complete